MAISDESGQPQDDGWEAVEQELDMLVSEFQTIQTDVNYRHAQTALQDLVGRLKLTARERAGLEEPLKRIDTLLTKLEESIVQIAVFGLVGRGKSSLLNALLGEQSFKTGPTHGVTQKIERVDWRADDFSAALKTQRVSLPSMGHSRIELIDTPGLDEVDGEAREALAQQLAKQVDLILFVIAGDITRVEYEALKTLRAASKPIVLVFNKVDQYPDIDRQIIYETLRDQRLKGLISPEEIVMVAADPLVAEVTQKNGRLVPCLRRGEPQVEALKLKILDLLHKEGKSLIALNTLLYADEVNERIVERKRQICDRMAEDIIWNSAMVKSMAVALNPIMLADMLSGAVVDVVLIISLSRLYGLPMTQSGAFGLLRQIALGLGGITASELLVTLGLGSLKSILGLSFAPTGGLSLAPYIPVAITQAAVAGVSTYSIGQITKIYLTNGATWGPLGPKVVVRQIIDSLDETSILNRIKDELQAKLGSSPGG